MPTNFQPLPQGYGSYLDGILPKDLAVAAGSFSASMQQITNIKNVNFEKFAQVAASIEATTTNLPLINGTSVPVDLSKASELQSITSMGSGPYGTYTMSDFFGCMSGLPYNWKELYDTILDTQTTKLSNIYRELFLATTWEGASITVLYTTSAGPTYTVTGVAISDSGGGYGRGGAPAPIITIAGGSGATATCTIGTDSSNAGSIGSGTFGRVTTVTLTSAGITTGTIPTATIECPPTATLAVQTNGDLATGGVNTASGTAGWASPMNAVVQAYIDQANAEILSIASVKSKNVKKLNTIYNYSGKQLAIEQRTRYTALSPVPDPRDRFLSTYPMTITNFVDSMSTYATSTRPHMYAQTLEAISDLSNVSGQSAVGLMRQERNIDRLQKINIPVDSSIPGKIETELEKPLIANGTLPVGKPGSGIDVVGINGDIDNPTSTYTVPSTLKNVTVPRPIGYFDPNTNKFMLCDECNSIPSNSIESILSLETISPDKNINLLGPSKEGTGPAVPILNGTVFDVAAIQSGVTNAAVDTQPIAIVYVGLEKPACTDGGQEYDDGSATYPGSLAGSSAVNFMPPELDLKLTSSVLLPSTYCVDEAVEEVIKCNCDCWID